MPRQRLPQDAVGVAGHALGAVAVLPAPEGLERWRERWSLGLFCLCFEVATRSFVVLKPEMG